MSSKNIPQNDYETAQESIKDKQAGISVLHSGNSMKLTFNLSPTLQTDNIDDNKEYVDENDIYPNNSSEQLKKFKSLKFHEFGQANLNQSQSEQNVKIPQHFESVSFIIEVFLFI